MSQGAINAFRKIKKALSKRRVSQARKDKVKEKLNQLFETRKKLRETSSHHGPSPATTNRELEEDHQKMMKKVSENVTKMMKDARRKAEEESSPIEDETYKEVVAAAIEAEKARSFWSKLPVFVSQLIKNYMTECEKSSSFLSAKVSLVRSEHAIEPIVRRVLSGKGLGTEIRAQLTERGTLADRKEGSELRDQLTERGTLAGRDERSKREDVFTASLKDLAVNHQKDLKKTKKILIKLDDIYTSSSSLEEKIDKLDDLFKGLFTEKSSHRVLTRFARANNKGMEKTRFARANNEGMEKWCKEVKKELHAIATPHKTTRPPKAVNREDILIEYTAIERAMRSSKKSDNKSPIIAVAIGRKSETAVSHRYGSKGKKIAEENERLIIIRRGCNTLVDQIHCSNINSAINMSCKEQIQNIIDCCMARDGRPTSEKTKEQLLTWVNEIAGNEAPANLLKAITTFDHQSGRPAEELIKDDFRLRALKNERRFSSSTPLSDLKETLTAQQRNDDHVNLVIKFMDEEKRLKDMPGTIKEPSSPFYKWFKHGEALANALKEGDTEDLNESLTKMQLLNESRRSLSTTCFVDGFLSAIGKRTDIHPAAIVAHCDWLGKDRCFDLDNYKEDFIEVLTVFQLFNAKDIHELKTAATCLTSDEANHLLSEEIFSHPGNPPPSITAEDTSGLSAWASLASLVLKGDETLALNSQSRSGAKKHVFPKHQKKESKDTDKDTEKNTKLERLVQLSQLHQTVVSDHRVTPESKTRIVLGTMIRKQQKNEVLKSLAEKIANTIYEHIEHDSSLFGDFLRSGTIFSDALAKLTNNQLPNDKKTLTEHASSVLSSLPKTDILIATFAFNDIWTKLTDEELLSILPEPIYSSDADTSAKILEHILDESLPNRKKIIGRIKRSKQPGLTGVSAYESLIVANEKRIDILDQEGGKCGYKFNTDSGEIEHPVTDSYGIKAFSTVDLLAPLEEIKASITKEAGVPDLVTYTHLHDSDTTMSDMEKWFKDAESAKYYIESLEKLEELSPGDRSKIINEEDFSSLKARAKALQEKIDCHKKCDEKVKQKEQSRRNAYKDLCKQEEALKGDYEKQRLRVEHIKTATVKTRELLFGAKPPGFWFRAKTFGTQVARWLKGFYKPAPPAASIEDYRLLSKQIESLTNYLDKSKEGHLIELSPIDELNTSQGRISSAARRALDVCIGEKDPSSATTTEKFIEKEAIKPDATWLSVFTSEGPDDEYKAQREAGQKKAKTKTRSLDAISRGIINTKESCAGVLSYFNHVSDAEKKQNESKEQSLTAKKVIASALIERFKDDQNPSIMPIRQREDKFNETCQKANPSESEKEATRNVDPPDSATPQSESSQEPAPASQAAVLESTPSQESAAVAEAVAVAVAVAVAEAEAEAVAVVTTEEETPALPTKLTETVASPSAGELEKWINETLGHSACLFASKPRNAETNYSTSDIRPSAAAA